MVRMPPSGTVTLLFTDVQASTSQWEAHPHAMAAAIARHDDILRSEIEQRDGYVFKTVGDAFCAAFSTPRAAAEAALASQDLLAAESWPSPVLIRVRMALHSGVCEERGGDYFGPTVNRVARLESVAHGGQILLSGATAELLKADPPVGGTLTDLGEHQLKDLERPERVFQLTGAGHRSSFPQLRSPARSESGGRRRPAFLEQDDPDRTRHALRGDRLTIGRDRGNDVVLEADMRVSRRHARVVYRDGQWVLHDDGSSNGTFLGTDRIATHPLRDGDRFRIGSTVFRFCLADDPLGTNIEPRDEGRTDPGPVAAPDVKTGA